VQDLLKEYNVILMVITFDEIITSPQLEELISISSDSRILKNPSQDMIKEVFLQIQNYQFQSTPLILETFN